MSTEYATEVRAAAEKILRWGVDEARERDAGGREAEDILIAADVDDIDALDALADRIDKAVRIALDAGIAALNGASDV